MFTSFHARAQVQFDPAPSLEPTGKPVMTASKKTPAGVTCVGVPVTTDGGVPSELGLDRAALDRAGFSGEVGQTLVIPRSGAPTLVAFGIGDPTALDVATLRDAAAAFARAAAVHEKVAVMVGERGRVSPGDAARAMIEGVALARYRFLPLKRATADKLAKQEAPLAELTVVAPDGADEVTAGVERGVICARATELARDLSNAPATLLTARRMADIARALAAECNLEVEVFDEEALSELACGGILGVNAGSVEPPRMIKLTYRPKEPALHVSLVAKGIMYDSGGISLKPNDLVHATMKGDMSGAAAALAAMSTLSALDCRNAVTAYLMCTDNMPSGTAMKLGDVLQVRGGTTVEVQNTDAEGRLVMADALVLSTELDPKPDAIVDIATLTGACQRALGTLRAGVMGNDQGLVDQVVAAAERTDEPVWQLPLERRYRKELESEVADMKNVGGENAGALTAALFLEEFVAGIPWAHLDIAGTARSETDDSWRSKGATGFGTRLLIELLTELTPLAVH